MPNDYNYEQLAADVLGISVEENARRNAEALRNTAARRSMVQTATEQRIIEREARRNRAVQTPRGSSEINYEFTANYPAANSYIVSVNQSRPIHDDFDSGFAYNLFLNSKYKHHHKCATCQTVFRCGQAKCDRTLCKLCDLRTELSAETVLLNFNGSFGGRWHNNYMVHEASERAAQNQVTVDYEAVERQLINEETATGRVDGDIEV